MPISPDQLRAFLDGDTATTDKGSVRFTGVDAPEMGHAATSGLQREPGAEQSRQFAEQYTKQPGTEIDTQGTDAYDRTLAEVSNPQQGTTLAGELIQRGLGMPMGNREDTNRAFYKGAKERVNPSTPEQARLNQQLDAEWSLARPNRHNLKQKRERTMGEVFGDALDRGLDQMGMMAGGTQKLIGEGTGFDMLTEAGNRRIEDNRRDVAFNVADIGTLDKVNTAGDAVTWAVEKLGEQGPNLAAMIGGALATGGAGAVLAGGARMAGEKLATNAAIQAMNVASKALTKELGAVGAGATLNVGESKLNLDEADPNGDHNMLALATGLAKTGLDVFSLRQMPGFGKLVSGKAKAAGLSQKEALKVWGDVPKDIAVATLTEGSTEGLQTLLDEGARIYKAGGEVNWAEVRESMAAGALVGGVMGGMGGGAEVMLRPGEIAPDRLARPEDTTARVADLQKQRYALQEQIRILEQKGNKARTLSEADAIRAQIDQLSQEDMRLGSEVDALGGTPPPGGTTTEPPADIAAQTAAVADPNHDKTAQWIANPTREQIANAQAEGLYAIRLRDGEEDGILLSADPDVLDQAASLREAGASVRQINEQLLGTTNKAEAVADIQAGERGLVRQNVTPEGAVVSETGTSESQLAQANAQMDAQLGEGEQARVVPVEQAQAERSTDPVYVLPFSQSAETWYANKMLNAETVYIPDGKGGARAVFVVGKDAKRLRALRDARGTPEQTLEALLAAGARVPRDDGRYGEWSMSGGLTRIIPQEQDALFSQRDAPRPGVRIDSAGDVADRPSYNELTAPEGAEPQQGGTPIGHPKPEIVGPRPAPAKDLPNRDQGRTVVSRANARRDTLDTGAATPEVTPPEGPITSIPRKVQDRVVKQLNGVDITSDELTREGKLGTPREDVPAKEPNESATHRLMRTVKQLPFVREHINVRATKGAKIEAKNADGDTITLSPAAYNERVAWAVARAIEDSVAEANGFGTVAERQSARREKALRDDPKLHKLLHDIIERAPDRLLERRIEALWNDKRFELNRYGRPKDMAQDTNQAGLAQPRQRMDDDNNRLENPMGDYAAADDTWDSEVDSRDPDEVAAESYRQSEGKQATPEMRRWWKAFALALGEYQIPVYGDATKLFEVLRKNPILARKTPAQVADWVAERTKKLTYGRLEAAAVAASQGYARVLEQKIEEAQAAGDTAKVRALTKAYEASTAAAEEFNSTYADDKVLNDIAKDIADDGVDSDIKNAGIDEKSRTGARKASAIEEKKSLEEAEGDAAMTVTPDFGRAQTLVEKLFGNTDSMHDGIRDMLNRTRDLGGARDVLRDLQQMSRNKTLRLLLVALRPFVKHTQFDVKPRSEIGGTASYDPKRNIITVADNLHPTEFLLAVLHESMHAATHSGLRANKVFADRITRMRERAAKAYVDAKIEEAGAMQQHGRKGRHELARTYWFDEGARKEIEYGLKDNDEFVAQLFSSPEFIDFLEGVAVERKAKGGALSTLLQQVIGAIRNLLGLQENTSLAAAAMDDVLLELAKGPQARVGGDVVHSGASTTQAEAKEFLKQLGATRPAKAAKLAAAREYAKAGAELTGFAKSAWGKALDIAQPVIVANWDLRRQFNNNEFGNRIANDFFRRVGDNGRLGAMQRAHVRRNAFLSEWNNTFYGKDIPKAERATPEQLAEAWTATEKARAEGKTREQLAAENPLAGKMQDLFAKVDEYVQSQNVNGYQPLKGIYLPQIHDIGKISNDAEAFRDFLVNGKFEYTDPATGKKHALTDSVADTIVRNMTKPHEHAEFSDLPYAGSLLNRVLSDPKYQAAAREAGWLRQDPDVVVDFYLSSLTKQVEFEARFGDYRRDAKGALVSFETMSEDRDGNMRPNKTLKRHVETVTGQPIMTMRDYDRGLKHAERLGMVRMVGGGYQIYARDERLQRMIEDGLRAAHPKDEKARNAARARTRLIISGYMGQLGADMSPTRRHAQQWIMALQTITTLAFSAVSSIAEVSLQLAFAPSAGSLKDAIRTVTTDYKGTKALLDDIGLGWDQMVNIAALDNSTYGLMEGAPKRVIDLFFKANGQHLWTQLMRGMSAQMALSHFKRLADAGDTKTLQMHGLTPDAVYSWIENRQQYTAIGNDIHPMIEAMHRFIDERVIMPDASTRPTFMNDPRWALVGQLKSFFYAYGSKVLGGMGRRMALQYSAAQARGDTAAMNAIRTGFPLLVLGASGAVLAALAGELKDRLKYEMWGEEPPAWHEKHGMEFWLQSMRQSGILGPMDMAINLFDEDSSGVVALLGPAASHLEVGLKHGFFSEQFLTRSTPVLSQLPGARKFLAEQTGIGDGL